MVVQTVTRHYFVCSECHPSGRAGGWPNPGYATEEDALEASRQHWQRHVDQPFCICATVPALSFCDCDEDPCICGTPEPGHNHCRERICCECGCLTHRVPTDDTTERTS